MKPYVVTCRVEMLTPLDQPDRGWCQACQLPSTLTWHLAFEISADFDIRTISVCMDCGLEDWT